MKSTLVASINTRFDLHRQRALDNLTAQSLLFFSLYEFYSVVGVCAAPLTMEYHFMESPNRTEVGDTTYIPPNISREASFVSPAKGGRNDLLNQMRGHRHPLATPRNALAALRQSAGRPEFTPLLNSGTKKRILAGDREEEYRNGLRLNGALSTPALLKPGYKFESPALPEASIMDEQTNSSSVAQDVSLPPAISSSAVSTPMALPKRGQEGMLDNGNVLTLREQEAVRVFSWPNQSALRAE
jgi:hypothetical protein